MDNNNEKKTGRIIFFAALLSVYAVITLALGVLFEYNTIRVSKGEIIFSAIMSWQLILFFAEFVTIIIQLVVLIKMMGKSKPSYQNIIKYTGMAAGGLALVTVIILLITDGLVINPTGVFAIYALLIVVVRTILLPKLTLK